MCVALFNEMLKAASEQYDREHNASIYESLVYRNQISFCSKFLHFHVPYSIFSHRSLHKRRRALFMLDSDTEKRRGLEDCAIVIDKAVRETVNAWFPTVKDFL